jgi:hypothetical protein
MAIIDGELWLCEWCSASDISRFVDNYPEKCKILECQGCGAKTWHVSSSMLKQAMEGNEE